MTLTGLNLRIVGQIPVKENGEGRERGCLLEITCPDGPSTTTHQAPMRYATAFNTFILNASRSVFEPGSYPCSCIFAFIQPGVRPRV